MTLTKSKGATLAVSLVMLTAVTFVAVLALQRSTLQTKMVANTQHSQQAFSIASSELAGNYDLIETSKLGTERLAAAMNNVAKADGVAQRDQDTGEFLFWPLPVPAMSIYGGTKIRISTSLHYISGRGITINRTLSGDSSQNQYTAYHFRLRSTATATENIKSEQVMGIRFLAAQGQ